MAPDINALTFDWYGTLANHRHKKGRRCLFSDYLESYGLKSAPWDRQILYDVYDYYSRAYGPELSDDEKMSFWVEFTKLLFSRTKVSVQDARQCEVHALAIRDILGPDCFQLYDDVKPVLVELKRRNLRLAVISNWHRGLDLFCREMNLAGLLDCIISSSDVGFEKPDSRIFHEASRQLGVKPEYVVHIGDSPEEDFSGAIAAGFRAILIDRENVHSGCVDRISGLRELGVRLNLGA